MHVVSVAPGLAGVPARDRFLNLTRWTTVLILAVAAVCCIVFSLHWRMAVDTPVMHYVVFLLHHGLRPYSEITDNNMPGTYLTEAAAMAVFGRGDLAWRVYEFFLMAVFAASAAVMTRSRDWVAGVFAAGIFMVLHAAEGPQLAGERDLVIGVLLMAGCASLFESVDCALPALAIVFGFTTGVAAAIKPTVLLLPLALLIVASAHLHRQRRPLVPTLAWALLGQLLAAAAVLLFLFHFHAFSGFVFILLHVIPAYRDISRLHLGSLLADLLPRAVLCVTLLAVPLALRSALRHAWDWRLLCVCICAGFGLLSYFAQGKGYVYHRYVFLMFLLVLVGTEIFTGLAQRGWPRWLAGATLLLALAIIPGHLRTAHAVVGQTSFELTLERDLSRLGSHDQLDGHVQCFDLVYGCLDSLYHLELIDNSGFTGDMLFFAPRISPPVLFYRNRFWHYAQGDPASVIVVSNGVFAEPNSYAKLNRWPEFERYLGTHYTLVLQRSFPHERYAYYADTPFPENQCDSYRLYVLNSSPLLNQAKALDPAPVFVGH